MEMMDIPSDKELAKLQADMDQRQLLRGGRRFLLFFRACLFMFLAIGIIALPWVLLFHRGVYPVVFLTLWNLVVLAMIRLVSTQLEGIKREQEAEQNLGGDSENRAKDGTASGAPQG
jgi:hypothetical protein